jgi:hypothetical protein
MRQPYVPGKTSPTARRLRAAAALALLAPAVNPAAAQPGAVPPGTTIAAPAPNPQARTAYASMVRKVAAMPNDPRVTGLARRHKLDVVNVMWEDTGRYRGSSVGPNISDVTIEVEMKSARGRSTTALMPVMRYPNFTDKTGDVAIDRIWLPVGNQTEGGVGPNVTPEYITLKQLLEDPTKYMSLPTRGKIKRGSLLAKRDSHVLVSAQATFLPIPSDGEATFWPVIFNYQSTRKNPAVLTLLVTRQGTSMTVIDNTRDSLRGQSWGQRIFFNKAGQRAPLIAERLSRVESAGVTANGESADSLGADSNLLMIIQVPLRYRRPPMRMMAPADGGFGGGLGGLASGAAPPASAPAAAAEMAAAPMKKEAAKARAVSDVETAVLGHGPELGPYVELDGLKIERDPRFPVRVTVQFYQATSNGVVNADNVQGLAAQIAKVYASADYVGSLVAPSKADRRRPTNWNGVGPMPPGTTCADFPGLVARGLCPPKPVQPVRPIGPIEPVRPDHPTRPIGAPEAGKAERKAAGIQ